MRQRSIICTTTNTLLIHFYICLSASCHWQKCAFVLTLTGTKWVKRNERMCVQSVSSAVWMLLNDIIINIKSKSVAGLGTCSSNVNNCLATSIIKCVIIACVSQSCGFQSGESSSQFLHFAYNFWNLATWSLVILYLI